MDNLKQQIAALGTRKVGQSDYLSYRAVTDKVAAFLFPGRTIEEIGEKDYQQILETADTVRRKLGYTSIEKLVPPTIPFGEMGPSARQRKRNHLGKK